MHRRIPSFLFVSFAAFGSNISGHAHAAPLSFASVGFLSSTTNKDSVVSGISDDGNSAIGESFLADGSRRVFRWSRFGGLTNLGTFTSYPAVTKNAWAGGISIDGAVLGGMSEGASSAGFRPFRWTSSTGLVNLGTIPNGADSYAGAKGINADGTVLVGEGFDSGNRRATRWTAATGSVSLGVAGGLPDSVAVAVNASGDAVVGSCTSNTSPYPGTAFLWRQSSGMIPLGNVPGLVRSTAFGLNDAATIVAGFCSGTAPPYSPFRWTPASGMKLIPLPAWATSGVLSVKGDGSVLVGTCSNSSDPNPQTSSRAMIWTARTGFIELKPYLASHGIDLSQWSLTVGATLSRNGRFVGGRGYRNNLYEGWVASLPEQCPADLNTDGFVDDSDFVLFATAYDLLSCADPAMTEWCPSDLNLDGAVDDPDFVLLAIAYDALLCP